MSIIIEFVQFLLKLLKKLKVVRPSVGATVGDTAMTDFLDTYSEDVWENAANVLIAALFRRQSWIAYCKTTVDGEVYTAPELRP